jgi:hypothetical protein
MVNHDGNGFTAIRPEAGIGVVVRVVAAALTVLLQQWVV